MQRVEMFFDVGCDPGQVFDVLGTRWTIAAGDATASRWTCLDTADWRLHRRDMTLRDARHGRHAELVLYTDAGRIAAPARVRSWPSGLRALPPSELRDRLAPVVANRALLPLAEVAVRSIPLGLLDSLDKTRVRVRIDQQALSVPRRRQLPLRVLIDGMRGYESDARRCADLLGTSLARVDATTTATLAMTAAGYVPGQPAAAPLRLDADGPAADALARVLRSHLETIDALRPGVLADTDIEYLHEMRTAIRAARSVIRLAAELLPAELSGLADEFAWLGRLTTPLRDLDMYLADLSGDGELDVTGIQNLDPLRRYLGRQRTVALRGVRSALRSRRATALIDDRRGTLDAVHAAVTDRRLVADTAARHAYKAYRGIVTASTRIDEHSSTDELHRLRRRCKRMRYLLQSYQSVYEPRPYREVVLRLKGLQDCLGRIQDADTQQRELASAAQYLSMHGAPVSTVLAMGALSERTTRREAIARGEMMGRLARFCGRKTRLRVRDLAARTTATSGAT